MTLLEKNLKALKAALSKYILDIDKKISISTSQKNPAILIEFSQEEVIKRELLEESLSGIVAFKIDDNKIIISAQKDNKGNYFCFKNNDIKKIIDIFDDLWNIQLSKQYDQSLLMIQDYLKANDINVKIEEEEDYTIQELKENLSKAKSNDIYIKQGFELIGDNKTEQTKLQVFSSSKTILNKIISNFFLPKELYNIEEPDGIFILNIKADECGFFLETEEEFEQEEIGNLAQDQAESIFSFVQNATSSEMLIPSQIKKSPELILEYKKYVEEISKRSTPSIEMLKEMLPTSDFTLKMIQKENLMVPHIIVAVAFSESDKAALLFAGLKETKSLVKQTLLGGNVIRIELKMDQDFSFVKNPVEVKIYVDDYKPTKEAFDQAKKILKQIYNKLNLSIVEKSSNSKSNSGLTTISLENYCLIINNNATSNSYQMVFSALNNTLKELKYSGKYGKKTISLLLNHDVSFIKDQFIETFNKFYQEELEWEKKYQKFGPGDEELTQSVAPITHTQDPTIPQESYQDKIIGGFHNLYTSSSATEFGILKPFFNLSLHAQETSFSHFESEFAELERAIELSMQTVQAQETIPASAVASSSTYQNKRKNIAEETKEDDRQKRARVFNQLQALMQEDCISEANSESGSFSDWIWNIDDKTSGLKSEKAIAKSLAEDVKMKPEKDYFILNPTASTFVGAEMARRSAQIHPLQKTSFNNFRSLFFTEEDAEKSSSKQR